MRKSSKRAASNVAANVPAIIENETAKLETVSTEIVAAGPVLDNATGETVDTSAAIEATPDERVLKAERIAADRAAIRAVYSAIEANRASVPVKALSAFKLAASTVHPVSRNPSIRQAAAIAVAFAAAGVKLADGAKASRTFEIDGVPSAIENGVMRDMLSSGLIHVSGATPETETLKLAKNATKAVTALLGSKLLSAAGLI